MNFTSTQAQELFTKLYGLGAKDAPARYEELVKRFHTYYAGDCRIFSAPGRTEIGGNHTDHQNGRVLAAAVSLDTLAAAVRNGSDVIHLRSEGFEGEFVVDLTDLIVHEDEYNTTQSLIRGVAARMKELGYAVGGFDAYVQSTVLRGSGLSSSAAFEVLLVTIFDHLFNQGEMDPKLRAIISQYAENVYFGKPCGLMDQMASSVGGLVTIDFLDLSAPDVRKLDFDFDGSGYYLAVSDTGGAHDDLTQHYAAITQEMTAIAQALGEKKLGFVKKADFEENIARLAAEVSERAVLRAMHFFADNERVLSQCAALETGDMEGFFALINESGQSSWMLLQNCYVPGSTDEKIPLALSVSANLLKGRGAWRVHGGGFAGTIQAFVPEALVDHYTNKMNALLGAGRCTVLSVRQFGAMEISL